MSTESATLRADVERHTREHVEGERARVKRVSRIRELVLGAQDGLLVPLGVVTGMAAANPGRTAILVAGLAEAVPDRSRWARVPISPRRPRRRSTRPRSMTNAARWRSFPSANGRSLPWHSSARVSRRRRQSEWRCNPNVFLRTKVEKELGLSPEAGGAALGDGIVVGLSYVLAAIVPLWPYVSFGRVTALVSSSG